MVLNQKPVMIVNFKTYPEATGRRALELSKGLDNVRRDTGVNIIVAAQMTDIFLISQQVEMPVFAQHVDPDPQGAHTGHTTPEAVKTAGGSGTLLNHSEKRLKLAAIDETVRRVRAIGLTSVVCANNALVGAAIAALGPDFVAVEPPELIGTGVAVSKAKPEVVTDAVASIRRVNPRVWVLCGAGITDGRDASSAMRLGAHGILVSSGVVKAKDPVRAAFDLARSMQSLS
jgi:triosephosphate isomerase